MSTPTIPGTYDVTYFAVDRRGDIIARHACDTLILAEVFAAIRLDDGVVGWRLTSGGNGPQQGWSVGGAAVLTDRQRARVAQQIVALEAPPPARLPVYESALDESGRIVTQSKTQERHTLAEWDRRDSETHGVIRSDAGTIVGLSRVVQAYRDA
jgi:hypothetical protein